GHALSERRERVVEDAGPLVVVLEDMAHEDPGDRAAVRDEVDHFGATRRGGAVETPVAVRWNQRAQPARSAAPILCACAIGEPGSANFVAGRFSVGPRLLKTVIPGSPLADVRHHNTSRAVAVILDTGRSPRYTAPRGTSLPCVS